MIKMYALVIAQVLLSLGGLYKIKTAPEIFNPHFVCGFALYGISFMLWVWIIRAYALSVAFPLATSLSIICSQLVGIYLLGEGWGWLQCAAVVLIICGVILLSAAK